MNNFYWTWKSWKKIATYILYLLYCCCYDSQGGRGGRYSQMQRSFLHYKSRMNSILLVITILRALNATHNLYFPHSPSISSPPTWPSAADTPMNQLILFRCQVKLFIMMSLMNPYMVPDKQKIRLWILKAMGTFYPDHTVSVTFSHCIVTSTLQKIHIVYKHLIMSTWSNTSSRKEVYKVQEILSKILIQS